MLSDMIWLEDHSIPCFCWK